MIRSRAPLLFVALAFGLGILLRASLPLSWGWVLLLGVGTTLLRVAQPAKAHLALLLCVAAVGSLWAGLDQAKPTLGPLPQEPHPAVLRGTLISDLEPSRYGQSGWLNVESVRIDEDWQPVSGKLRLKLPRWAGHIGFGDRLKLMGLVRAGKVPTQDYPWDEARWLWLHQAQGVFSASDSRGIERLNASRNWVGSYRQGIAGFRLKLKRLGRHLLNDQTRFYLESLLLGERRGVPRELKNAFRSTGTIHVLVVSGLHVGLIGFLALLFLTACRIPRKVRYGLLVGILVSYCFLVGARMPIFRATLMGSLLALNLAWGRAHSTPNALGLAALVILGFQPRALWDPSFQLSFAAVAGIVLVSPLWSMGLVPKDSASTKGIRLQEKFLQALAVSGSAWLAVTPLIAWHFHSVSFIAPLANLVVVPWASLLVATGLLLYMAAWISPVWASPLAAVFSVLAQGLSQLVSSLASLPGAGIAW